MAVPSGDRLDLGNDGVFRGATRVAVAEDGVLDEDAGGALADAIGPPPVPIVVFAAADLSFSSLRSVARAAHGQGHRSLFLGVRDEDGSERTVELELPDDPFAAMSSIEEAQRAARSILAHQSVRAAHDAGTGPDAGTPSADAGTGDASSGDGGVRGQAPSTYHILVDVRAEGVRVRSARGAFAPGCRSASLGLALLALRGGTSRGEVRDCLSRVMPRGDEADVRFTIQIEPTVSVRRLGVIVEAVLGLVSEPPTLTF